MKLPTVAELTTTLANQMQPALPDDVLLIGIQRGGMWVTEALANTLGNLCTMQPATGSVSVALYRDDYGRRGLSPSAKVCDLPGHIDGKTVVLVDDVLHTGRTVRAAMNVLFDYGRPAVIHLAVLVTRGGRQLPIEATWQASSLELQENQTLELKKSEHGELTFALLTDNKAA